MTIQSNHHLYKSSLSPESIGLITHVLLGTAYEMTKKAGGDARDMHGLLAAVFIEACCVSGISEGIDKQKLNEIVLGLIKANFDHIHDFVLKEKTGKGSPRH